ncbi:MAG TPA: PAS domain-containing protein, partial [Magnetospirillum sp.]|nr:PAS domain-containing protein [Magnetospirillum sp.]
MRASWGKLMAGTAVATVSASAAWAQGVPEPVLAGWPDPVAMLLGAAVMLPFALPLLGWQRWRLGRLEARSRAKMVEAMRLRECLAASPDGFYCWLEEGEAGQMCSRRLAVLLSLGRGIDSSFEDVLGAFLPEDSYTLDIAARRLREEGEGFEAELSLAGAGRRVRAIGVRAASPEGERLADLIWMQDVTESAGVVEDLARSLQALASDTAFLRALIDALPMPVWLRDEDLSLLTVNRAYAVAVDAASPDAAVAGQVELASDNLVREARALAARARAAGEPRAEHFHLVLSGERRLASVTEVPLSVGETLLTAGFAQDQTRIEELQSDLAHHVAAHGEVLERLSTAIAIYSTDTKLTFFNTAFARLWRLDRDWLMAQPTYGGVLDALRERRLLPETAD